MEDYKKKYEEAMLRMNKWVEGSEIIDPKEVAEFVFPELKESEDELMWLKEYIREEAYFLSVDVRDEEDKIKLKNLRRALIWIENQCKQKSEFKDGEDERVRKSLIDFLKSPFVNENITDEKVAPWISWLEKQGEQKPADKVEPKFKIGDTIRPKGSLAEYVIESISGGYYHGKGWGLSIDCDEDYELVEQRPAWSEEDEKMWITISDLLWEGFKLSDGKVSWDKIRCWLLPKITYFKDRVQTHPKQEWSEEDEKFFKTTLWHISHSISNSNCTNVRSNTADWLKSLKGRMQFQNVYLPSDEQMQQLYNLICDCRPADTQLLQDIYYCLKSLKERMKGE